MNLSPERVDHLPDNWREGKLVCGRVLAKVLRVETNCPCGIRERHIHCLGCGHVISISDWSKPGILLGTVLLPKRDWQ